MARNREKGIQIQQYRIDFKNLLPHHILTSPIFDLDDEIIPEANENLSDLRTGENYYKALEIDKMMDELKTFEESDRDFPEDLFRSD